MGPTTQGSPDVAYGEALQEYLVTWEVTAPTGSYDVHGRRAPSRAR